MFSAGEVPYLKISINHATIRDIDIASQEVAFDALACCSIFVDLQRILIYLLNWMFVWLTAKC